MRSNLQIRSVGDQGRVHRLGDRVGGHSPVNPHWARRSSSSARVDRLSRSNSRQAVARSRRDGRQRLAIAEQFGARACDAASGDPVAAARAWTSGTGVDAVLITASAKTDEIVHQAAEMCRKRGRIVLVGVVGLNLRRADFYEKELTFQVSCSYGPGRYDESYEQKGQDYPSVVRWTEVPLEAVPARWSRASLPSSL